MLDLTVGEDEARWVLANWDVGEIVAFPGERGGTANPAVVLDAAAGRFFLKRRNPRYSASEVLRHDHALMEHLAAKGLCTPLAMRSREGRRWVESKGSIYELYPYITGEPHDPTRDAQVWEAGRALACFHQATESFQPPPGKEWPRYHAPELTIEALQWAQAELADCEELRKLLAVVEELAISFPYSEYAACTRTTVHGDWHPANVRYWQDRVCGIFDLDWATRQPRLVDLADGVAFFAGERARPVNAADIRSLTQPFRLSPARAGVFLDGYRSIGRLEAEELRLLPKFLLARWLWCRADPMRRKVPREEAVDFLLDGIWGPIEQISQMDVSHITLA